MSDQNAMGELLEYSRDSRDDLDRATAVEAAAVLGGIQSRPGVILGGLILGGAENVFGYVWPDSKPIVALIVIVLVLCFRPSGLFVRHYIKKV